MRASLIVVALFPVLAQAQAGGSIGTLTLPDAVLKAVQTRQSVRAATLLVQQAEATRSALGVPNPIRIEAGNGTLPTTDVGEDLLLAIPVDLFGKARSNRATGDAAVFAARSNLLQVKLDLQLAVINSFADAQSAQALVQTGQDILALDQQAYDATSARIAAGDLRPLELLRADLELQRGRQALALRQQTLIAARTRLAASMGVTPDSISDVSSEFAVLPVGSSIETRPDVLQFRSQIASARADSRVAGRSRFPDIELQLRRSPWELPEFYNARIQVVLPLFDYGAVNNRAKAARFAQQSAERSLQDRLDFARKEVTAAQADLEGARQAVEGFGKLTADAKALLQKEQRGYPSAVSLLDILDATRAVRDIEESAVAARLQLAQAQGRYLSATGTFLPGVK